MFNPDLLYGGIALALSFKSVLLVLIGTVLGVIIGAIPGLGPLMGIILLLPVVISLTPVEGVGLLMAIFVGGSCGGAISAILLGIPGTPLAAATLLDGHPMAKKGKHSEAIGLAFTSSALGGLIAGVFLIFFTPMIAHFANKFAPPEYAALAILGLVSIAVVSKESTLKGIVAGLLGLLLATIGTDDLTDGTRFTFDSFHLLGGFHIVSICFGLFAISEVAIQLASTAARVRLDFKFNNVQFKSLVTITKHLPNLIRSSIVGAFIGALPGTGGVTSAFTAYSISKGRAKPNEKYGEGEPGGIVATESANNATCGGVMIPTLSLGIPGDASSAILMSVLLILGFFPGPQLFNSSPEIVSGIFYVYILSNIFLLAVGIFLAPLFASILRLREARLFPIVLLSCAVGTFAVQYSVFDLWAMLGFGVLGTLMRAANFPLAPVVIGVVLGPIAELNIRKSLLLSDTGFFIFIQRPISLCIIVIAVLILGWLTLDKHRKAKQ